jgi:hypothetical protein
MGRVTIKPQSAHQHILRIGGFENRYTTGLKHPDGFIEHIEQHLEWEMLDDVKTGHTADTAVGQGTEIRQHIPFYHVKPSLTAFLHQHTVALDPFPLQPFLSKQL